MKADGHPMRTKRMSSITERTPVSCWVAHVTVQEGTSGGIQLMAHQEGTGGGIQPMARRKGLAVGFSLGRAQSGCELTHPYI